MSDLLITAIVVGERRREDYGDIDGLAASIKRYGLLHPIVVDEQSNLIAGGRRLQACRQLGWSALPVTLLGDLTDAERREIELEENLRRKDLTPAEEARVMVQLAETAREVIRQQPEEQVFPEDDFGDDDVKDVSAQVGPKPSGRPSQAVSTRSVSERIGIPRATIQRAEQHVETADQHPFMQQPSWKQAHVLEARQHLEKLPEEERPAAAKLIDQPGIPPRKGVAMLGNLAKMAEPDRREVLTLQASPDRKDRDLAITMAAKLPKMPDPRMEPLARALADLKGAGQRFPADPLTPRIQDVADEVGSILDTLEAQYRGQ